MLRAADIPDLGTDELEDLKAEALELEREYRELRQLIECELRLRYHTEARQNV